MSQQAELKDKSALVVGVGGLGCPAALALARAGVGTIFLCDDDKVDETNLHRQVLFSDEDIGRDKLDAARDALQREHDVNVTLLRTRLLPDTARQIVGNADIVLEGADNFPTKFLAADACYLEGTPIIHGAAIRFVGTAFSVSAKGSPCYRCLFEDLLHDSDSPGCSEAGVIGPAVGIVGALMADLALDVLLGDSSRQGKIFNFDGKKLSIRPVSLNSRKGCRLCGAAALNTISDVNMRLYTSDHTEQLSELN